MKKPEHSWPPPKVEHPRSPSPKIPQPIPRGGAYRRHNKQLREMDDDSLNSRQGSYRSRTPQPSRPVSPQVPEYFDQHHAENFFEPEASPPPPPPPAHRIAYTRHPSVENNNNNQGFTSAERTYTPYRRARTPSPAPSPHTGLTPSPLRDAMNDVMTSLEGMAVDGDDHQRARAGPPEGQPEIWSPDAFDQVYEVAREQRPNTSIGFAQSEQNNLHQDDLATKPHEDYDHQLSSYVERMERRLDELHRTGSLAEQPPSSGRHYCKRQQQLPSRPPSSHAGSRPGSSHANQSRPGTSYGERPRSRVGSIGRALSRKGLRERKSAYELGKDRLARTFTNKSNATTASSTAQSSSTCNSNGTSATSQSLMSGHSAGGFSATSAGSWARRKFVTDATDRPQSALDAARPSTAMSGFSYHASHASSVRPELTHESSAEAGGLLGGLASPIAKKRGLFQRIKDTARTSAASARSNISTDSGGERPPRPRSMLEGIASVSGGKPRHPAQDMGLGSGGGNGSGVDWVQMRRDVNRSNSLSRNERNDRAERCQMLDIPVMNPADILNETAESDEGADGYPVPDPQDFSNASLALVDKSARFVTSLPTMINAASLAQTYLCRQHRSEVQKLRSIFTWVSERVSWEEDYEGSIDPRRVIVSRRGCSEEIATLVAEMCLAVGLHAEIVRGYLKAPAELFMLQDLQEAAGRPNHWWNAVIVEGEWRMIDCALASPSNPRRNAYSSASNQVADSWYFLSRPLEFCYTHVPLLPEQQHILPPLAHDVLLALPVACPAFFKNGCAMYDFDTSLIHLEKLEMAHVQVIVPDETELHAEVETQSFARDADGDFFESGDSSRRRALAQAEYITLPHDPSPLKRYTIKAVLPPSSTHSPRGTLNIYAGKRGLMQGLHKNPHSIAMSLPLLHDGSDNPPYDFFLRHPTPHALRHELYVVGPLCKDLAVNNTFVFGVRQHPSRQTNPHRSIAESARPISPSRPTSAMSIARPSSAMSMASVSASGSAYSNPSNPSTTSDSSNVSGKEAKEKPAKLAIQSPSGKILRMTRKVNAVAGEEAGGASKVGSSWETIIKIGERGTWRGLVLADRSARWCVWGEWECV